MCLRLALAALVALLMGSPMADAQMPASAPKIPLVLGFANFSGDDLAPLAAADAAILSPLFETVRILPAGQIPGGPRSFYLHAPESKWHAAQQR
jgi:hypothetical protein